MRVIEQAFKISYSYNVFFTEEIFGLENNILASVFEKSSEAKGSVLFVVDKGVDSRTPDLKIKAQKYFTSNVKDFTLKDWLVIEGGEVCKNNEAYLKTILSSIDQHHIDRHSYVVAIGGGAVLDVAGYAATIAHRGIKHIRIPTTVLSQDDSAVGVKNGINYFFKKNFLGTFNPPHAVINDYNFLNTLDQDEYLAGFTEAIKVALVKDPDFFYYIKQNYSALKERKKDIVNEVIYRSALLHMQHIASSDPFERANKRPLDFGHWAAHKLETLSGFSISHGKAVAVGIALDSTISYLNGMLKEEDWSEIISLLLDLGLNIYAPQLSDEPEGGSASMLYKGLEEFREHLGGKLSITLLTSIGTGVEVDVLDRDVLEKAIKIIYNYNLKRAVA